MLTLTIKILIGYYFIINIVSLCLIWYDKRRATRNKWRIPESNLFIAGILGGGIGGFIGMKLFHHKTRKASFYIIYSVSIILHAALIYFIIMNFNYF